MSSDNISRALCFKSQQMAHTNITLLIFLPFSIWFGFNMPFNKTNVYLTFTPHLTTNNLLFYLSSQPSTYNILIQKLLPFHSGILAFIQGIFIAVLSWWRFQNFLSSRLTTLFNLGETIHIPETYMVQWLRSQSWALLTDKCNVCLVLQHWKRIVWLLLLFFSQKGELGHMLSCFCLGWSCHLSGSEASTSF